MPVPYQAIRVDDPEAERKADANDAYAERLDVAKRCLAGMIAFPGDERNPGTPFVKYAANMARDAVVYADALLAELAKPKAE